VLDSSAVAAILFQEADAKRFSTAIEGAPVRLMSAGTYLELCIVAERRSRAAGMRDLDRFFEMTRTEIVPFDAEQARIARAAYRRYGRGNHRAGLNFGDCFAYALAKATGEPLLYKGVDFARTDVTPA
jgi:ribonuclease VapC